MQPVLVDPSQKSLVDTLGSQLMTQLGGDAVSRDASTYDRIGQLIGLAVSTSNEPSDTAASIRQSLAGAQIMNSPGEASRSALVLVVLGDNADDAILSGVLSGLAAKATGVVVAGDTRSGLAGGLQGPAPRARRRPGRDRRRGRRAARPGDRGARPGTLAEGPGRQLRCVGFGRRRPTRVGWNPVKIATPTKHVFVTGGVASSLGKGLTASSLGQPADGHADSG